MNFDISIEKRYLAYIIRKENFDYLHKTLSQVNSSFFHSQECKDIFKIVQDYFNKYSATPTKEVFITYLKDLYGSNLRWLEHLRLFLKSLYIVDTSNREQFNFVFDSLKRYRAVREFLSLIDRSTKNMSIENAYQILSNMEKGLYNLNINSTHSETRRFDLSSNILDRLKSYDINKQEGTGISTGLEKLDKHIGGWRRGEFIVIVGKAGTGKSAILLNFAENAAVRGHDVLLVTIEMSYEEILTRYHSLITNLPYHRIRNFLMSDEERTEYWKLILKRQIVPEQSQAFETYSNSLLRIEDPTELYTESRDRFRFRENKLVIVDMPRNCTPQRLETECKMVFVNRPCNLLVVDYLGVMDTSGPLSSNYVQNFMVLAKQMKGLARSLNIPIISAAQMNDNSEVKYSRAIKENVDWMINFRIDSMDKDLGQIFITLSKHRHAEELSFPIANMLETMKVGDYL